MLFNKKTKPGEFELVKEGQEEILVANYNNYPYSPSIEDSEFCMARTIDALVQYPSAVRIIFNQKKNYEYSFVQSQMLIEIANIYNYFIKQKKLLTISSLGIPGCDICLPQRHADIQYIILNLLRVDPIGAFVETKRLMREEAIKAKSAKYDKCQKCTANYLNSLNTIFSFLNQTKLINLVKQNIAGHKLGDRTLYRSIFRPVISPDFIFTRLMSEVPIDGEEIDAYKIDQKNDVAIFKIPQDIKPLYHLNPTEFKISEDKYALLELAKSVLSEHKPKSEEFTDPERIRKVFFNVGRDLITELATHKNIELTYKEIEELAEILVRYTVGFGLLETILKDDKVQDININGPIGQTPIFLNHADYEECRTNIVPSKEDGESWATKFRILSGRPLDEANPILDTELTLPDSRTRVAIISAPLNPHGLAFTFRRHRDKPWTSPLFINNKMINPLGSGLMSFLIDGARSLVIAGTRGSGKCVDGNTLIQLSDGSIIPISHLTKTENIENEKKYRLNLGVMSLENYKIKNDSTDFLYKRKFTEKLIKIKTQSGKEIITTPEHPYFTFDKGIKEVFADHIKEDSFIASPRFIQTRPKEIEFNFDAQLKEDHFIFKGKTNSLKFKFPKKINVELAEFLGYVSGDGHIAPTGIYFFNNNQHIRETYKTIIKKLFDVKYREYKTRTTFCIRISSRNLSRLISSTFGIPIGKKSSKLEIPQQILQSNNSILSAYIKTLFDCDSHVSKVDIEFASASDKLVKQLQMTLLRFGIISFKKIKIIKNKSYSRLFIRGESTKNYSLNIGYNHPQKKKNLSKLSHKTFNTNIDIIPQSTILFKELRKKLCISPKQLRETTNKDYWGYENEQYNISRNWFQKIISYFNERYNNLSLIDTKPLYNLLNYNPEEIITEINELKNLLNIPYTELSTFLKTSDTGIRKLLTKNKTYFINSISTLNSLPPLFEDKLNNLNPHFNYAEMSRTTNIPETTLKSYFYGGIALPEEKNILIKKFLENYKDLIQKNKEKAKEILNSLKDRHKNMAIDYMQIGILLNKLREELNISNEAIASKDIAVMTVSNFFTGKYENINLKTIKTITKNILKIHKDATSSETKSLLELTNNLANSEIFWDKVIKIEKIKPQDGYVYDLSVPRTHNFIANGIIAHNTSFLDSCLLEIMRKYRIITVEDTLELSIDALRNLGYNIQSMKVRAALTSTSSEVPADEGIRTSLRLGDSALIVGEIRSKEALALYEAMRIGALANVVAGTIHGDSPYGVFDRVVNDLGVPRTSFKATDIIVIANPIKSADGLHKLRRVTQITEVRKQWEDDPQKEGAFVDLMKYDAKIDSLKPTDALINGDSEIVKSIAGNVKEWAGNWDAVWENILLRARIKDTLVKYAQQTNMMELLEAPTVIQFNDIFHKLLDSVKSQTGSLDSKKIYFEWEQELRKYIKKRLIAKTQA